MARLPLVGGSYSTRSIIASAQRCVNYFPEINPQHLALVPVTHYQRPGLRPLVQGPVSPVRGLYQASNGIDAFAVIGSGLYLVGGPPTWQLVHLGDLTGSISSIVSMIDNGIQLLVVNGSPHGWTVDLAHPTTSFKQVIDPTGIFEGADKVDYIDTFVLWNMPGTNSFGSTLSNQIEPFDATYTAAKTNYPDKLQTLIVNRHEILLFGKFKTEMWYDAGNPLFPFAELPGAYIEHGIIAKYSLASQDVSVFWLAMNLQGQGMVLRQRGYQTTRISNHALEYQIRKMYMSPNGRIDDAIGYCYQLDGHVFYVLHFPTGDQTWVFDDAIGDPNLAWHQEAWTDSNGLLHRHRGNCFGPLHGHLVVGDWENGTLYEMDPELYADLDIHGARSPLTCIRTFPHIGAGASPAGGLVEFDGHRLQFTGFRLDLQVGEAQGTIDGLPSQIGLRWSDDRGRTFNNDILQSSGQRGEYLTQPQWLGLGIARYRVFEINHGIDGPAALNGAWVDATVLGT